VNITKSVGKKSQQTVAPGGGLMRGAPKPRRQHRNNDNVDIMLALFARGLCFLGWLLGMCVLVHLKKYIIVMITSHYVHI